MYCLLIKRSVLDKTKSSIDYIYICIMDFSPAYFVYDFLKRKGLAFLLHVLLLLFKIMSLILVNLNCPVRDD